MSQQQHMPPQARGWMASVSSIAILVIFSLCSICCVDGKIAQPPRMVLAKPSASHTGNVPRGRRLDDTADDIGSNNNTTASYFKCYSLLEQVTASSNADSSVLGQEEYLAFLRLLTGGTVSYDRFADLPAVYVMIFYTAACITPDDCQQDSEPVVRLNNDQNEETTADQSPTVQLFCKQILKSTPSAADAVFDYSIRYNPENLNIEDLAVCLSTATVNVLLEQLAGCPFLSAENSNATTDEGNDARRQRARNLLLLGQQAIAPSALLSSLQQQQQYSSYSYHSKKELRRLQSLGTVSTPEDSACQYAIESTVESITELPCEDIGDVGVGGSNSTDTPAEEVCALVRSTATVETSLLFEPFPELLRIEIVGILRRVINGGDFLKYFPEDACVLS